MRRYAPFFVVFLFILGALFWTENRFSDSFRSCIDYGATNQANNDPNKKGANVAIFIETQSICTVRLIDKHNGLFSAIAAFIIAWFTFSLRQSTNTLANIARETARRQERDTEILQRAYIAVEPRGIEMTTDVKLVGQIVFKNVGRLPATAFASVVKEIMVADETWVPPTLTDADLLQPGRGIVPIGGEIARGTPFRELPQYGRDGVNDKTYLFVWGRAKYVDGFGVIRFVDFCHSYPFVRRVTEPTGGGYTIPTRFARYPDTGNDAD
jgi:hypothetical protein